MKIRSSLIVFVLVMALDVGLWSVDAVEFNMLFMTKCISEEIPPNSQVEIEYHTYDKQDATRAVGTKVNVEDPHGATIYDAAGDISNITFKATDGGDYKACFNVPSNVIASRIKLKLEWRMGATSFDWDDLARKEHLDEIDGYMQRFARTMKGVNDELKDIRIKEQEMRQITEATNTRVVMFSLSCVVVCVAITVGQLWYLRRFFTKRKII